VLELRRPSGLQFRIRSLVPIRIPAIILLWLVMGCSGTYRPSGSTGSADEANGPATPGAGVFSGLLPVSFSGLLPCADCPGVRHVVELYPDHAFVHRMSYIGKGAGGGDADVDQLGHWEMSADGRRLELQTRREQPMRFDIMSRDSLDLLDALSQPIHSTLNYTLTRDAAFSPIEPQLVMRGMYAYMADAGWFAECITGWRLPVAMESDNLALERGYAQAHTSPGAPVLVDLEGRIARRPSMEEGSAPQRMLVPIHFNSAWPGATCATMSAGSGE